MKRNDTQPIVAYLDFNDRLKFFQLTDTSSTRTFSAQNSTATAEQDKADLLIED